MLERMRESSRSGLTMVLFAIIIVVFAISFGAPMDGCQQSSGPQRAATVAGTEVMTDEVRIIYARYGGRDRNLSEQQLAEDRAKALKALVIIHLLADEARKIGLRVGEDELLEYIKDPLRNAELAGILGGRTGIYQRYVLNQLRVSEVRYQEYKKTELLARKYLDLAEMQVGVLPGEIEDLDKLRNTKVNLEYVKLSPATLRDRLEPTEDELAAYVEANADKIKKAYEDKKEDYSEPAQVRIRRVYIIKPGGDASDEEKAKKAEKFAQAKKRILENKEDFGAVAKELSEDFAKDKEGLMDWTALENMDQNIAKALEGAKQGDVKELETDFAYMVVKLEGRKEAKVTPLEEVQSEIAKGMLRDEKVDELIQEMADQLKAKVAEKGNLKDAVEALKAEASSPEDAEGAEGEGDATADAAEGDAPAEEKQPSIWEAVTVRDTGLFSLEGQDLSKLFGGQLPPGVSLGMGDWDRIPGIGKSPQVALDAFKLTEAKPTSDKIYNVEGARVLIRLKERQEPEAPEGDEAKKQQLEYYGELRQKRLRPLAGNWQNLFLVPGDDFGPWLEKIYADAVKSGRVTFNADRVPMAKVLRDKSPIATATAPAKPGAKKDGAKEDAPAAGGEAAAGEDKKGEEK